MERGREGKGDKEKERERERERESGRKRDKLIFDRHGSETERVKER